ncbi:hypothetical protein AM10699_13030 [Acaryochloris marina MBIC10699]|nr:hypothetical protein AM10699_13030 [Acaryochloris marina MBIC10699]
MVRLWNPYIGIINRFDYNRGIVDVKFGFWNAPFHDTLILYIKDQCVVMYVELVRRKKVILMAPDIMPFPVRKVPIRQGIWDGKATNILCPL